LLDQDPGSRKSGAEIHRDAIKGLFREAAAHLEKLVITCIRKFVDAIAGLRFFAGVVQGQNPIFSAFSA
jgi:hypothetical protein